MEAAEAALPGPGEVVAEKYRVERLVGEGSMGRVFRAHHLLLGHSVAIKFLRSSMETDDLRVRFIREAKATMALRSDHVVRVFDLGVLPESNTPYMVLEYLEGTDLRSLLETRGALPVEEAVDYVLQVTEALAEAHLNGIVHRDLKPQNLFLTRRPNGTPCIKLLDFGVSKLESRSGSKDELTMSHVLLGSPVFISPEQIRDSRKVDARADVWSLGVVLYMLLGGGRPFEGEGLAATCASIMVDAPKPLSARCPAVPPALEAVIFRCLDKSRERRTQNVAELARELEPFASAAARVSAERVVHLFAASPSQAAYRAAPASREPMEETASLPRPRAEVETSTAVEATSIDAEPPRHLEASPRRPEPRAPIVPIVAAALFLVVAGIAGAFAWHRVHAVPEAVAATAALPSATEKPAETDPAPKSDDEGAPVVAAPSAVPAAAPPRRGGGPSRATKPSGAPSAKRKGQVDRNGVPIVD